MSDTSERPRTLTDGRGFEDVPLLLTVSKAAKLIGISKGALYAMIRRGEVETLLVGRTIFVKTRPLLRMVGVDVDTAGSVPQSAA